MYTVYTVTDSFLLFVFYLASMYSSLCIERNKTTSRLFVFDRIASVSRIQFEWNLILIVGKKKMTRCASAALVRSISFEFGHIFSLSIYVLFCCCLTRHPCYPQIHINTIQTRYKIIYCGYLLAFSSRMRSHALSIVRSRTLFLVRITDIVCVCFPI